MNSRDAEYLCNAYTKYYGRLDSTKIDVLQMNRGYKKSSMNTSNPFLSYAITQKSDDELRVDQCSFKTLLDRINLCFQTKQDSMGVETIFKTLDKDEDSYYGIQDVLAMNQQLGSCFTEEQVKKIMEQISDDGGKLNRQEFKSVFWK